MLTRYELAEMADVGAEAGFEIGWFLVTKFHYVFAGVSFLTVIKLYLHYLGS